MNKNVSFIVLQASVVFNQQLSMSSENYEDTKAGRNIAFRGTIEKLKEKKILKINPRITEYILVYKVNITEVILYCQLAKRTHMDTLPFVVASMR